MARSSSFFLVDPDAPANPDYKEPALEQTGFRLLAHEVDDDEMDEAIACLERKGIAIHSAHPTNPARWFRDPDGNQTVVFPLQRLSDVQETGRNQLEEFL